MGDIPVDDKASVRIEYTHLTSIKMNLEDAVTYLESDNQPLPRRIDFLRRSGFSLGDISIALQVANGSSSLLNWGVVGLVGIGLIGVGSLIHRTISIFAERYAESARHSSQSNEIRELSQLVRTQTEQIRQCVNCLQRTGSNGTPEPRQPVSSYHSEAAARLMTSLPIPLPTFQGDHSSDGPADPLNRGNSALLAPGWKAAVSQKPKSQTQQQRRAVLRATSEPTSHNVLWTPMSEDLAQDIQREASDNPYRI